MLEPLRRRLAAGAPPPVVAAVGPESWLREEVVRAVATAVLGSAESPDVVVVQGEGSAAGDPGEALTRFLDEARTPSLFGGAKVAVLRGAGAAVAEDRKAVIAWLARPGSAGCAVLLAETLPDDVEEAVQRTGVLVRCGGRGAAQEPPARFVIRRAAARGKRLGGAEADLLVDAVGEDLASLENAVEILSLHAGDEPGVASAAIHALFPGSREGSVWAFAEHLVSGDVAAALGEAAHAFDEGIPEGFGSSRVIRDERTIALRLVSEFGRSAGRARALRRQLDRGVRREELDWGGRSPPPRAQQEALRTATSRRPEALDALVVYAEETDRGMKSGGTQGRLAVTKLAVAVGRVR